MAIAKPTRSAAGGRSTEPDPVIRAVTPAQQPFQLRFSSVSALPVTFGTSQGARGEVVIVMLGDGSEMEITLVSCQAEEPDQEVCHVVP